MDALEMELGRSLGGEVNSVQATGDVRFKWSDAAGTCDEFSVDMERNLMVARGKGRPAEIQFPDKRLVVSHLEYYYRTKMAGTG